MSTVTLDNKTVLVTGTAGFVGSNLVKRIYQEAPFAKVMVSGMVWLCLLRIRSSSSFQKALHMDSWC